jgi:hypothetical protein
MLTIQKNLPQEKPIDKRLRELLEDQQTKDIDSLLKIMPCKDELSLEDVFILVYCVVSDFLNHVGGQKSLRRSNNNDPEFTDAEVMTIAIIGELAQYNSQNSWYRYVRKNYLSLFPKLCSRTRFSRRHSRLYRVICFFQQNLCFLLSASHAVEIVVDSFPIEICNLQRVKSSNQPFGYDGADYGYCAAKKLYYYGFKGHLVTDLRGVPIFLTLTSASVSDLHSFEAIIIEMIEYNAVKGKNLFIGDKGYVGEEFQKMIEQNYGVKLLSMQREYKKDVQKYGYSALNELLKKSRHIIETSIDLLSVQLNAGHTKRRTIKGLVNSLITKMAAFNLANYFNLLLDEPLLQITSFVY